MARLEAEGVDPRRWSAPAVANRFGEIALVRNTDQAVAGAERADDLGGGRQERDDPRGGERRLPRRTIAPEQQGAACPTLYQMRGGADIGRGSRPVTRRVNDFGPLTRAREGVNIRTSQ